jgi:hypothetical protein
VAGERIESLFARTVAAVGEREVIGRIVVGGAVQFSEVFYVVGALLEDQALKQAGTAEAPGGGDELIDQDGAERIGRGEMGAEGGGVGLEIVGAFGGDEEMGGGEPVLGGVEAGAGLAFGGARSGAELGVGAIGFVLFICGGHICCCPRSFGSRDNAGGGVGRGGRGDK